MKNSKQKIREWFKNIIARGGIIVFFIMAFEVMIMISPFAFFFYSVFNPIFHWLNNYSATRWLTNFFLPHMILPPTFILKFIRITGSILFLVGFFGFIICALQVYLGKIFKWGIADKGLYRYIRHPQYLTLGIWGIGMAILWSRFIVLATLSIMFILYYFLAKDEEDRMSHLYGDSYQKYMDATGMFLPSSIEKFFSFPFQYIRSAFLRKIVVCLTVIGFVIGSGFLCRYITMNSLQFQSKDNVTLVPIMPEDNISSAKILDSIIIDESQNNNSFLKEGNEYLGYVMPVDYIMQGMIANTGTEHHLFMKHQTVSLITDWVFHPFEHLRRSPAASMAKMHNVDPATARRHHCALGIDDPNLDCENCPYRRVIILKVTSNPDNHTEGKELLSFNSIRQPVGYIDINTKTGQIVNIKDVGTTTAWENVPTPGI